MRYSSVAVSVLAVACAACSAGENPSANSTAANEAAVHDVGTRLDEYVATAKSGNVGALGDFFAPDAIIWEPELKATRTDLVQTFDEFGKTNVLDSLRVTAMERVSHDGGSVVYEFGHFSEMYHQLDRKKPAEIHKGNYVMRWVKSDDSRWRIHRFLITDAPPDSVQIASPAVAIAPADGPATDAATVTTHVNQAMSEVVAKINAGDVQSLLNAWADDIQLYEPQVQFMSRAALVPAMQQMFGAYRINLANNISEVFVHDDGRVAYQLGDYRESLTLKEGNAQPDLSHNAFLARWKRTADGGWSWDRMIVTPLPKDSAK